MSGFAILALCFGVLSISGAQSMALPGSSSCAGVVYKGMCITLPYKLGPGVKYAKAQHVCRHWHNAHLAEITEDEMYNVVYQYVQQQWLIYTGIYHSNWNYVYVWLGSRFEPLSSNKKNIIILRSGKQIRLKDWMTGNPQKGIRHAPQNRLMMRIRLPGSSNTIPTGIWNINPEDSGAVPLCVTEM